MKKVLGFSLVELMVTLIIISVIISALTPMITKKLKSQGITVSSGGGGSSNNIEFEQDCSAFGVDCALCFSDRCAMCAKECNLDEYVDTPNCRCVSCDKYENCLECTSKQCTKCSVGYYIDDGICKLCPIGNYCDGNYKINCENGKYQDIEGQTSCKTCESKTENCANCDIGTGECLECGEDYELKDGSCTLPCGDLALKITTASGKICMTKYNVGDKTEFNIPNSVNIVSASTQCTPSDTNFCCWKGKTASNCSTANGAYSGCNRTLCDWRAARKICNSLSYSGLSWRVPTIDEWLSIGEQFDNISKGQGDDGLMLCDYSAGYVSAYCARYENNCLGALFTNCYPYSFWAAEEHDETSAYRLGIDKGTMYGPYSGQGKAYALSVRCVADL